MPKTKPADVTADSGLPALLFEVQETTLPNGLKVRLMPNRAAPVVSLFLFYRVGSRNERPGITGISHLFEHMMFNGAKKYGPKEFDSTLESHGGRSNAYTTPDLTVYHEEFASEALEKVLDLESDRMRSLTINDKSLRAEREVVKEERRVRVDNEIIGLLDEELGALVWKAHPYRWPVIGWMGDIDAINRHDCEQYFKTYYAPNNATLFLVGDFDKAKALALIRKYFGTIKKGPTIPTVINSEPEQKGERRAVVRHPAQAPAVLIGYRGPSAKEEDTLALDIIQYALSVGESSRLVKSLVYREQLAVSVSFDWGWRVDPGLVQIYLELKPDSDPQKVEKALYAELQRVGEGGLTEPELQKAKNNLKAHLLRELATNSGRANAYGNYEMMLGSWRDGLMLASRYKTIDAKKVQEVARRTFRPELRSVVTLHPEGERP
jgi:predicted Zn-dependent peptidase